MEKHISVLLNESISSLNLDEDSIIVDATLGYGGHSSNILDRINKGYLFAFDQDSEAIRHSTSRLNAIGTNFTIIKSNFVYMKRELEKLGVNLDFARVDGLARRVLLYRVHNRFNAVGYMEFYLQSQIYL